MINGNTSDHEKEEGGRREEGGTSLWLDLGRFFVGCIELLKLLVGVAVLH